MVSPRVIVSPDALFFRTLSHMPGLTAAQRAACSEMAQALAPSLSFNNN